MNKLKNIYVRDSASQVARGAARFFFELCFQSIRHDGHFAVALPGGKTPEPFFNVLSSDEFMNTIPWKSVHLFWGDERCVPPGHPDSNYNAAASAFISKTGIPADNVHRMRGEDQPHAAAAAYEAELRRFFKGFKKTCLDLVFLGLGEDGHTLSLFPGSQSLNENERLVAAEYVEAVKSDRMTMTLPVVNNASNAIFLVTGKKKAGILKAVLEGGNESRHYPASLIRPTHGRLIWIVDKAAASLLKD